MNKQYNEKLRNANIIAKHINEISIVKSEKHKLCDDRQLKATVEIKEKKEKNFIVKPELTNILQRRNS